MTAAVSARERAMLDEIADLRAQLARLQREVYGPSKRVSVPSIERLVDAAAAEFGVSAGSILSRLQVSELCLARQVVMYLAVTRLHHGMPITGRCLNRDHTTVQHGVRRITALIETNPALAARIERVAAAVQDQQRETAA